MYSGKLAVIKIIFLIYHQDIFYFFSVFLFNYIMPPNTERAIDLVVQSSSNNELPPPSPRPKTIVVVGLGMVAVSFIEKVIEYDEEDMYQIKVFSEEPEGKMYIY